MSELDAFKSKFLRLLELREEKDADEAKAKKSKAAYREAEAELYAELEDAGIRGRLEFDFGPELGVAKFQRRSTPYGRVLDKFKAAASLRAEGLEHIIADTKFEEGRLNELVRTRLETKKELPEGVDFYYRKGISISRK